MLQTFLQQLLFLDVVVYTEIFASSTQGLSDCGICENCSRCLSQLRRQKSFQEGGQRKKTRPKNSTVKPPSTLSVLCMFHGHGPTELMPHVSFALFFAPNSFQRLELALLIIWWQVVVNLSA